MRICDVNNGVSCRHQGSDRRSYHTPKQGAPRSATKTPIRTTWSASGPAYQRHGAGARSQPNQHVAHSSLATQLHAAHIRLLKTPFRLALCEGYRRVGRRKKAAVVPFRVHVDDLNFLAHSQTAKNGPGGLPFHACGCTKKHEDTERPQNGLHDRTSMRFDYSEQFNAAMPDL